jgi:hypothetical protein
LTEFGSESNGGARVRTGIGVVAALRYLVVGVMGSVGSYG